jgi:hypothetical protein
MNKLKVTSLFQNDYTFKNYDCRIDLYLYPGKKASITNFECGNVGTGKGRTLLKETLDYLRIEGKLPPLLTLSASVNILASKRPNMTETEKEQNQKKLEKYYERLGFTKIDDPSNKKFLQKMMANTDDVLSKINTVGGNKKNKKTRKNKKGGNSEPINYMDVMYRDQLVTVLKPNIKKGIVLMTRFKQPEGMESLCNLGIKTSQALDFGLSVYHSSIFVKDPYIFKAPYRSPDQINYDNTEEEIISLYDKSVLNQNGVAFIRVDPDKTYVYSSNIRNINTIRERTFEMFEKSRKTLTEYLQIIKENTAIEVKNNPGLKYNLLTSKASIFPSKLYKGFPWDNHPINKFSEILVHVPFLTPDYLVLCKK